MFKQVLNLTPSLIADLPIREKVVPTTVKYYGGKSASRIAANPLYRIVVNMKQTQKNNKTMKTLTEKINKSIEMLVRAEKIALSLNHEKGIVLAFSGGKDSQCIYELAKMARVKFTPEYYVTGIDAPENIYHIKKNYPDVIFVHPQKNYFKLVEEKGLPMIQTRFCCERLKERTSCGCLLVDGVRAEESRKRAQYTEVMVRSRRKENIIKGQSRTFNQIEENEHKCIMGRDRLDVHVLLEWTEENVWEFIKQRNIPPNPLYATVGRVGCMFCPFAKPQQIEYYEKKYPLYHKRLLLAIERFMKKKHIPRLDTPKEYYDWWKSHEKLDKWLKGRQ